MIPEAAAEIQNQLAFVSAVIGGFSTTLAIGLLQLPPERRWAGWAAGAALVAAALLLIATVAGVWGALWIAERPALGALPETPAPLLAAFRWAGRAFLLGVAALLVSLGLSGWTRSRALGLASSITAGGAAVLLAFFLLARMGLN